MKTNKTAQIPTNPKPITIVALGDMHCGSRNAVCVPNFELSNGDRLQHGEAQRALYDAWASVAKDWAEPDILIANGDLVEGQARKESGVPVWSTDMDDQIDCAAALIQMFKAKKYFLTEGTGYHTDQGGKSLEHWIGERIGAEKIGTKGSRAAQELFLKVGDFTFHAAHHISCGQGWYRTTPMARELVFALLNESHKHKVDVILRSHCHYFCGVEFTRQKGFTVPCWQGQTNYMRKKSALGMIPDIGALRFIVQGDELKTQKKFFKVSEMRPKLFTYD